MHGGRRGVREREGGGDVKKRQEQPWAGGNGQHWAEKHKQVGTKGRDRNEQGGTEMSRKASGGW